MILRATEQAIQTVLQTALDDQFRSRLTVPVLLSDSDQTKVEMPYIVLECVDAEEIITPGCGIFKVGGQLLFRSHTKATTPKDRQTVLDVINNFAYDSTAAKLSGVNNFHCHGWHPTTGNMTTDNETKSTNYLMKYWVYCMAMDNS